MEEKPNYYAVIPAEVRYDSQLRPNEKLLYGEVVALSSKTGECRASNNYFAKNFEVCPSVISKWISDLEDRGYITVEYVRAENSAAIKERIIKIDVFTNMNRVLTKIEGGYSQKTKENNTRINNNTTTPIIEEKQLFQVVEENFGRTLSPYELEEIGTWKDTELTRYAIRQAILNGKYSIKYISKILFSYQKENVQTVQQAQKREQDFRSKKENFKKFQKHDCVKENVIPDWFEKKIVLDIADEEEKEEMTQILEDLGGENDTETKNFRAFTKT